MRVVVCVCVCALALFASPVRAQGQDPAGWTTHSPRDGARVVFVSSSAGRDENSGLSPGLAKRTLAAGRALLRSGVGDWLLLRRGDAWDESLADWDISGQGEDAVTLIGAYGGGAQRPVIRSADGHAFSRSDARGGAGAVSHLAIVGVRFEAGGGGAGASGVWWLGAGRNVLIEDCAFAGGANGIVLQGGAGRLAGVRVRRCVVVDVGGRFGHSQGVYAWGVDGLLIEECVFDGGGAERDPQRRMVHAGSDNTGVVVRGNLIARSPGDGVLLACGGVIEDNVVAMCPRAITLGGGAEDPLTHTYGVTGRVSGNAVIDCDRGITLENIGERGAVVVGNTLARGAGVALSIGEDAAPVAGVGRSNVRVVRNTVYDWGVGLSAPGAMPGQSQGGHAVEVNQFVGGGEGALVELCSQEAATFSGNLYHAGAMRLGGQAVATGEWTRRVGETDALRSAPAYLEPGRSLATYNASLGGAGTGGALLREARAQSRRRWREDYASGSIRAYLHAGLRAAPVADASP